MPRTMVRLIYLVALLPLPASHESHAAPKSVAEQKTADVTRSPRRSQSPSQSASNNRWRYRFHNGHWWYWRENGTWAYWTGAQWVKYAPESYRRWYLNWRVSQNEAEVARLKEMVRSYPAGGLRRRAWIDDPDAYLPFAN
jgi:hypothetical protein